MPRSNLYLKVELEHVPGEDLEKLGRDLCRVLRKAYGVRSAELASFTPVEE